MTTPVAPQPELRFKFLTMTELAALPETSQIADLLRDAATAIDCKYWQGAAWRVSDAVKLLRHKLKLHGHDDLEGFAPEGENT